MAHSSYILNMVERPRYRLHLATWLLLVTLCAVLVWVQAVGYRRARHFGPLGGGPVIYNAAAIYHAGWPLVFSEDVYNGSSRVHRQLAPEWPARLGVDVAFSLAGAASAAYVVERCLRARFRFRIITILIGTVMVGCLLAIGPIEAQLLTPAEGWGFQWHVRPRPWHSYPSKNWVKVTVTTFALGSSVYSAIWLAVEAASRLRRATRPSDR